MEESMAIAAELEDWAHQVAAASPDLHPEERQIVRCTYHLLAAQAEPVSPTEIAEAVDIPAEQVEERLRSWPLVLWDDEDRVVGFWGMHVHHSEPTHRIEVDRSAVYGWCAWDTLFITEILGAEAQVESTDPNDRTPVRLTVTPQGVTSLQPPGAVMSLLLPDGGLGADAIQSFCHRVHFFSSAQSAYQWMDGRPGMFTVSIDDAFELGRLTNRLRLGTVLGVGGGQETTV
jgi:alkylmercury lyase